MSLFLAACAVMGLGAIGLLIIMLLGARSAAQSVKIGPTPEAARIATESLKAKDIIEAHAKADAAKVEHESKSDLLADLRDSVQPPKPE